MKVLGKLFLKHRSLSARLTCMRISLSALAVLLLSAFLPLSAQQAPAPAYDVATIRPSPASSEGHNDFDIGNGNITARASSSRL